jgi:hypothetical protein
MLRKLIFTVLIAGLVASSVGLVGAQNATDQGAGANSTYVGSVDEGVRILDESYSDGSMRIRLEADRRAQLTVAKTSELNKFIYESGGGRAPSNATVSKAIPEGVSEITVPLEAHQGVAAVAIVSERTSNPYYAVVDNAVDVADPDGWGPIYLLVFIVFLFSVGTGFGLAKLVSDNQVKDAGAGA